MDDTLLGRVLGQTYAVERHLGAGGMGAVYAARHVRTGRQYALKTLKPEAARDPGAVRRFRREAEALASLGHPGIVAVHDVFECEDSTACIVMDLLEGEDLGKRLERGPLAWTVARDWAVQLCAAVAAAHDAGILHRDLKPSNILLARGPDGSERPIVLDFGLAKPTDTSLAQSRVTTTGAVVGTPLYMSPEQARANVLDARSDLYSLATVTFEMLTGEPPFSGPTLAVIMTRLLTEPAPLASHRARAPIPAGLDAVLACALAKEPSARFATMRAFADALRSVDARELALADTRALVPVPPTLALPRTLVSGAAAGAQPPIASGLGDTPWAAAIGTEAKLRGRGRSRWPLLGFAMAVVAISIAGASMWAFGRASPRVAASSVAPVASEPPQATRRVSTTTAPAPPRPAPTNTPTDSPRMPAQDRAEHGPLRPVVRAPTTPRATRPEAPRGTGPAAPIAPAAPVGPPTGVVEAVDRMRVSDWRGCIAAARAAPVSPETLQLQVSCSLRAHDGATLARACDEHVRRYPSHPFSDSCPGIVAAERASGGP